jgi:putative SOS response-associated peptidase YedK
MCGRFTHLYKWRELQRLMVLTTPPLEFTDRYNVAPTQTAPVVRDLPQARGREAVFMRWGLIPSWAKDEKIGNSLINARAEGIESKPAFRAAFKQRRCIVPVSGFYEWQKLGTRKQPHYITSSDNQPLALAGLWESWQSPDHGAVESFTVITTTPNEMMAKLHDRMPVILDPADFDTWLDPASHKLARFAALLKPYPAELMASRAVSTWVNSPQNEGPECLAVFEPEQRLF